MRAAAILAAFIALQASPIADSRAETPAKDQPVLVVFPFTSPDDGRTGLKFADSLRLRARRLGLVVVDRPSMTEAMSGLALPTAETPAEDVAALLRERFGAHLGLWGSVEPAGAGSLIEARGADARERPLKTFSEHYEAADSQGVGPIQDRILEALTGRTKQPPPTATPDADAKVATTGPNLVPNGDFEAGEKSPAAWQPIDGLTTFWAAGESPTGKCLKMDTDVYHSQWVQWREQLKAGATADQAPGKTPTSGPKYDTVAGLYGVAYFSDPIAVKPGQSYKVEVDYRGKSVLGGAVEFFPKLFIRGYGDVGGEKRVVYDAYLALRCKTQGEKWEHNVRIVTIPADAPAPVRFVRLMLYAYWPPNFYWFDNVTMKEVAPEPAGQAK